MAQRIDGMLRDADVPSALDAARGLDHGLWVPLRLIYPQVDVPIVELSIPGTRSPAELSRIGELLSPLRSEGVLILASGGIVHNLRRLDWRPRDGPAEAWALDVDRWFAAKLEAWDIDGLFRYAQLRRRMKALYTRRMHMFRKWLKASDDWTLRLLRLVLGVVFFARGAQQMLVEYHLPAIAIGIAILVRGGGAISMDRALSSAKAA